MASRLRPRGPLPAAVYWRRRVVILIILLIILLVLVTQCVGGSGGTPTARSARATPTVAHPRHSTPASSPSPSRAPSAASSSPASAAASANATVPACADSDLSITVATDQKSYSAGDDVTITLTVQNVGSAACMRDLGQAALDVHVVSGSDRVWAKADCRPGGGSDPTTLAPKDAISYRVVWGQVRSAPGCPSAASSADPGTYRAYGYVGDVRSDSAAVFTING